MKRNNLDNADNHTRSDTFTVNTVVLVCVVVVIFISVTMVILSVCKYYNVVTSSPTVYMYVQLECNSPNLIF